MCSPGSRRARRAVADALAARLVPGPATAAAELHRGAPLRRGGRRLRVRQRQSLALRPGRHRALDRGRASRAPSWRSSSTSGSPASRRAPARASRCRSRSASRSGGSAASSPGSTTSPTARRPRCRGAHDFGDGVLRHPVQLYESVAMAAFAVVYLWRVLRHDRFVIAQGFYLAVVFYGAQRFVWEFFKPYGTLVGPFTLFHLLSAAVLVYAVVMIATAPKPEVSMNGLCVGLVPYVFWGQTHVVVRDLPRAGAGEDPDSRTTRSGTRSAAAQHGVQSTLLSTDAAYWRHVQGLHQAGRPAARVAEPHRIRLPVRLRAVPGSRAAFVPGADRDQRALQSHLPGVLCRIARRSSRSTCRSPPSSACSTR